MFLIAFSVLAFLTSLGLIGKGDREHTSSFWAFDRNEKGQWEDVDRIIRR